MVDYRNKFQENKKSYWEDWESARRAREIDNRQKITEKYIVDRNPVKRVSRMLEDLAKKVEKIEISTEKEEQKKVK